jgi:hypothetical protein
MGKASGSSRIKENVHPADRPDSQEFPGYSHEISSLSEDSLMNPFQKTGHRGLSTLVLLCLIIGSVDPITAEAAKKKGGADPAAQAEAEFKKNLEPLTQDLDKLMIKIESRSLLSPDEAGKLAELKYKLLDAMNQSPQNVLIAKPVYQAGVLFTEREAFNDAFELFSFLATNFPANPYGAKARGQIQRLNKRFGPDYFIVETTVPPAPADPSQAKSSAATAANK